jgi:protein-tyrosine phosphatase
MLFRSSQLSALDDDELRMILDLGLKCIVDLRTLDERTRQPTRISCGSISRFESAKGSLAELVGRTGTTHQDILVGFERFYGLIPELYADDFRALFEMLGEGQIPLLVNCTAGKDRTGVACALILTFLGVPRADVIADYIETNTRFGNLQSVRDQVSDANVGPRTETSEKPRDAAWAADPVFIEKALAAVTETYGTVDNYVTHRLGIDGKCSTRIKESLLEPI